jgi:hypothetical protein
MLAVFADIMQCNIPLQNPAQQVTGKQGMEAPVVMQQASSAFNQGEASDEIIDGEVFERQSGVAANGLGVWGALEYLKYFSLRANVAESAPQYARQPEGRPHLLLSCQSRKRPKHRCRLLEIGACFHHHHLAELPVASHPIPGWELEPAFPAKQS